MRGGRRREGDGRGRLREAPLVGARVAHGGGEGVVGAAAEGLTRVEVEEERLLCAGCASPAAGAARRRAVPEELVSAVAAGRRGEGDGRGCLGAPQRGDGQDDGAGEVDRGAEGDGEDVGSSSEGA